MAKKAPIYLIASGDLRVSANQKCWPEQEAMERRIISAVESFGGQVRRANPIDSQKGHGFIDSQKYGMEVFRTIPPDAPLIVAEAVWQYSHHVLPGLFTHQGPILTVANFSGTWPGLVGLLNLNASLTKAGVNYSTLWSEDFTDKPFLKGLGTWLSKGKVKHDTSHVRDLAKVKTPSEVRKAGVAFAQSFRQRKAIMGVFDEGCMGMYNAIIPDELLHPTGVFKERLSQSSLYAKMQEVPDGEARAAYQWLRDRGVCFDLGTNEETELTEAQVLLQMKMYIAAMRIADEFGCDTIGIQYQQGLKDLAPASDLAEGLLNNRQRPPVTREGSKQVLHDGDALPHFNEVDECAGLDALLTYRLWKELGFEPENTLHDLRWGRQYTDDKLDDFVWVLLISGGAPPAHFIGGLKGTSSMRQPPMYFRLGGGTCRGISKPGWFAWSRVFVMNDALHADLGIGRAVELPEAETKARWELTTPQWPILHAVFPGITRDQMMARHKSNHIQVVYGPDQASARRGLLTKAHALSELGLKVSICGDL